MDSNLPSNIGFYKGNKMEPKQIIIVLAIIVGLAIVGKLFLKIIFASFKIGCLVVVGIIVVLFIKFFFFGH